MSRSRSSSIDSTDSFILSSSSSSAISSTISQYSHHPPHVSKREYLLAQIRHKDQIIESLLKQVGYSRDISCTHSLTSPVEQLHDPYKATPLSVVSYKAATSPSDSDNMNIVDWLDRLQSSIKQPATADPDFLRNLRNPSGVVMDDSEDDDLDADEDSADEEDVEKVRDTLPDVAVPIGLLANLALDKDKDTGKGRARGGNSSGSSANPEKDNDNVVSIDCFSCRPGCL